MYLQRANESTNLFRYEIEVHVFNTDHKHRFLSMYTAFSFDECMVKKSDDYLGKMEHCKVTGCFQTSFGPEFLCFMSTA